MKPLIVLITAFVITTLLTRWVGGRQDLVFSGSMAMFLMLCLTALAHFKFTAGMVMMIPHIVPFKKELVYITGLAELVLAMALLFPQTRQASGIMLVALFLAMLPANINAAIKNIDYENATTSGYGPGYLWFRVPLQAFFIAWVVFFSIRK